MIRRPRCPSTARAGPRSAETGTQHLLAEGVAAAILERVGVHADAIRDSSHRLFGPPGDTPGDQIPPMSTEATCALDAAAHSAAASTCDSAPPEVRTEHLLAMLALDPGSRARRVLDDLAVDIAAIEGELQCHITVDPARPARWWKRRPPAPQGCSFCGRTPGDVDQLVDGPGIAICGGLHPAEVEIRLTVQTDRGHHRRGRHDPAERTQVDAAGLLAHGGGEAPATTAVSPAARWPPSRAANIEAGPGRQPDRSTA